MIKTEEHIDILANFRRDMFPDDFLKHLQEFFYKRQDSGPETEEYREAADEADQLFYQLESKLHSDSERDLLFDIDAAYGKKGSLSSNISYRQGFTDGARIIIMSLMMGFEGEKQ